MTALLWLALAAAPGCPKALATASRAGSPQALAAQAPALVTALVERGAGGPAAAIAAEADSLARAAESGTAAPADAERFRARLARHCALAAERRQPRALRPGDRHALEAILARPEFSRARADATVLGRWLSELWRRILDLLGGEEAGRYASGGRTAFFAALLAALLAALVWSLRRHRAPPAQAGRGAPAATFHLPLPDESPARARQALARGLWAEAVRHAFAALLGSLERAGRIPRGRTLTNREMAHHLAALLTPSSAAPSATASTAIATTAGAPAPVGSPSAALARGFAELCTRFDRTVYGGAPVGAAEATAFLERAGELGSLVEARP